MTTLYLTFSLQSNYVTFDTFINNKAIAIVMGAIAMNTNIVVTLVSWTVIHPYYWQAIGWDSAYKVWIQVSMMIQHTLPLLVTVINMFFLCNATQYISDIWVFPIIALLYISVSYYIYTKTGWVFYSFLNWSDPSSYWQIVLTSIGLTVLCLFDQSIIAIITQAINGRWEWEGEWTK